MPWTNVGSLKGPAGDAGPEGPEGPTGPAGSTGPAGARGAKIFTGIGAPGTLTDEQPGDVYIDTSTGNLYTLS